MVTQAGHKRQQDKCHLSPDWQHSRRIIQVTTTTLHNTHNSHQNNKKWTAGDRGRRGRQTLTQITTGWVGGLWGNIPRCSYCYGVRVPGSLCLLSHVIYTEQLDIPPSKQQPGRSEGWVCEAVLLKDKRRVYWLTEQCVYSCYTSSTFSTNITILSLTSFLQSSLPSLLFCLSILSPNIFSLEYPLYYCSSISQVLLHFAVTSWCVQFTNF